MAGVWRCPSRPSGSPEGHRPNGRRYGGCAARRRGSPEGHRPNGRSLGVSLTPRGESRGAPPQWQEVWRMCLHKPSSLLFPLPLRKGARGMVRPTPAGVWGCAPTQGGSPEGHRPNGRSLGVSRAPKGESRGAPPQWQEVWRMCLHKPSSLLFPLPLRKGARGMVRPTPAGVWGCAPTQGGSPEGHRPNGRSLRVSLSP